MSNKIYKWFSVNNSVTSFKSAVGTLQIEQLGCRSDTFYLHNFEKACTVDGPAITFANPCWGFIVYAHRNYISNEIKGSGKLSYLYIPESGHYEGLKFKLFGVQLIIVNRSRIYLINSTIYMNNDKQCHI